MVQKYRNKYVDSLQETNRKEISQNLKKVEEDIFYTKQRINEDS